MNIVTEDDYAGLLETHPWAKQFMLLSYRDGGISAVPLGFFRTWLDEEPAFGKFHIGKGSWLGVGSIVKYDGEAQCLRLGRYVAGGLRLRFLLNGQHEKNTISMFMFSILENGMSNVSPPQCGDTVVKNDVWLGDEVMVLGGSVIENGCIIGARSLLPQNFVTEPYGIYAGTPARLKKFRFSEQVRECLLNLAWWEMPLSWIKENNVFFLSDLNQDEGRSIEMLTELKRRRDAVILKTGELA